SSKCPSLDSIVRYGIRWQTSRSGGGAAPPARNPGRGMTNDHVAIDGPVASGKTVNGRQLAVETGHLYLDTGAMYRAVAYLALRNGIDLDNERGLLAMLGHHTISIVADTGVAAGYRVV